MTTSSGASRAIGQTLGWYGRLIDGTLDETLWRPLLGHARYRCGLDGLYLAGAGAHPGGGVTGQNGQNAAREIVADWKKRRR